MSSRESLLACIGIVERELKVLYKYAKGRYVERLGIKATTPCAEVEDPSLRRSILDIVSSTFLGPRPRKAVVCHRCDNPRCVKAEHLFYGTHRDNVRDCVLKGRHSKGSKDMRTVRILELENHLKRWRIELEGVDAVDTGLSQSNGVEPG